MALTTSPKRHSEFSSNFSFPERDDKSIERCLGSCEIIITEVNAREVNGGDLKKMAVFLQELNTIQESIVLDPQERGRFESILQQYHSYKESLKTKT